MQNKLIKRVIILMMINISVLGASELGSLLKFQEMFKKSVDLLEKGQIENSLSALEFLIDENPPNFVKIQSIIFYSSIVLDKKNKDQPYLNQAVVYLKPLADRDEKPLNQFWLANLYQKLDLMENANKYLSLACNNNTRGEWLKNQCYDENIVEAKSN